MAPAKPAAQRVNFDLLDDAEPGDILQLHFLPDSVGGVAYLVGMINDGIITSPDYDVLLAIMGSDTWGNSRNQYVEFGPTATFSREWFESCMNRRIDQLVVKSYNRPLVDVSALDQPGASIRIRYRFKPGGVQGVAQLLELHDWELLELGNSDGLRYIADVQEWIFDGSRAGHFTNRLAGEVNQIYREYFLANIAPHLELLRSP